MNYQKPTKFEDEYFDYLSNALQEEIIKQFRGKNYQPSKNSWLKSRIFAFTANLPVILSDFNYSFEKIKRLDNRIKNLKEIN